MANQSVVDEIMKLSNSFTEIPNDEMYKIMMNRFQHVQNGVTKAFFPSNDPCTSYFGSINVTDAMNHLASITMCNTMRVVSRHLV